MQIKLPERRLKPESAAQDNVPNVESGANTANGASPENADAPKENLTVSDWNQYHLDHCWPYQKDEQCNEADWERFHDYLKNHALNYDSVRSLFVRYGDEIERTAQWIKEREASCLSRLDPGGGCDESCCLEEKTWDDLIKEHALIRHLLYHSDHPKEQYALWKLLDEDEAESGDEDKPKKSDEQKIVELRALIEAGADVWGKNQNGNIAAFLIKDKQILRELIQSEQFNSWRTDAHDRTLLHVLSKRGDIDADFISLLTTARVDINARDDQRNTPLGLYVLNNEPVESIVQAFIDAGADLYAANKKGQIPLYKLPPDMVLKLIENGKFKPDDKDAHGNTLMHIFGHHAGLVNYYMKTGFDFLSKNDKGEMPVFNMEANAVLELLKTQKLSPKVRANDGKTLLHIYGTHGELAKYLINAGVDINIKDNDGNTVLHNKQISIASVQQLVKLGANINAQNKKGETPLMIICDDNDQKESITDLECTQKLMELAADVKLRDTNGDDFVMRRMIKETYLDQYIFDTDEIIEHLKSTFDYKFSKISQYFSRHFFVNLIDALSYFNSDACNATIDDVNLAKSLWEKLLPELIEAGLDVHQKDAVGNTYLFYEFNLPLAYESLIKAGLNVNAKNNRGQTPLHQHLSLEMMKTLIKTGADVNAKDDLGRTPLFYNIQREQGYGCKYLNVLNKDVADYLLESGANINEKDKDGRTVLFYIDNDYEGYFYYEGVHDATLKYLVEHGIDLNAVDNEGKTALFSLPTTYRDIDITEEEENEACSIYETFMNRGGKLDVKDKFGRNILFYKPQLVKCFKEIAAQNPSAQLDIKALVNEPDNDGIKPLMYMRKGEFIKPFKSYFSIIYYKSPGLYPGPETDEFKTYYHKVMQLLIESGADAGCGLGGVLSEDMCVCGQIRYSQAEAIQWTCLGDLLRCLQHDGCSLFDKKYPVASDLCDAGKSAVNGYPCSERWKCDAESCNCHQIAIHSGDICVPGGVLAPNNGIYETQDDYNNRTSRCGGKHIADKFIAEEEDAECKEDNWYCTNAYYYDLKKQSWRCESRSILIEDKDALYCNGQPMPGVESDKSSYACIQDNWVCKKESCSCRTSMRMDDTAYSQIGYLKVCDLSGIIPNYESIPYNKYSIYSDDETICEENYKYSVAAERCTPDSCPDNAIYDKKSKKCRCPDGYVINVDRCVNKETACNNGKIYNSKLQTCVCPQNSVHNEMSGKCEFFKCQNGKCKEDFAKTCLTDIHACIEECPEGYVYDIRNKKCRKYKAKCKRSIDDLEQLASISCDFAARHGYDTGYGNDASWDQTFEYFDEECAEDNHEEDEEDDKPMEDNNDAADDNTPAPSTDKSTNNKGDIPKGMRLGPCYDTVYYGYGIHYDCTDNSDDCTDGGYYNIGTTVRCVSVNGCSCGESTCQKYGQCIGGQCHYDDFYVDLMCYAKDSFVGDWYDDIDVDDNFPITADSSGNCVCNHTILNPGFNYKNEYHCSQYGWLCLNDTGCRCGDIQCKTGSVCIAPGQCSSSVVPCSERLSPQGECNTTKI